MIITSKGKRHINGYKELTAHNEVVDLKEDKEVASLVYFPLICPNGKDVKVAVKEGAKVKVGTKLMVRNDFDIPVYCSVSGIVKGKEMRYSALSDVTDGKLLVGIAVNKNLAPLMTDPYNQIVYSDNSLICKQFTLPYEKTSRCRGTYYVFKDENGNPVKFNLKEGINEIYIGSRTTSDVVNINDIRIIPAS